MKKLLIALFCVLIIFVQCACTDTPLHALSGTPEISFEEMYTVFKAYEGMNSEQIADILDKTCLMDGQIPYRGSGFICGAGGNVLLGSISEYSGILEITWTGTSFPIECIRGINPGMEMTEVRQRLFDCCTPSWQAVNFPDSHDALRSIFRLTSCGELYNSPMRIELYFFFTADTLTAVKLSVCPNAQQQEV